MSRRELIWWVFWSGPALCGVEFIAEFRITCLRFTTSQNECGDVKLTLKPCFPCHGNMTRLKGAGGCIFSPLLGPILRIRVGVKARGRRDKDELPLKISISHSSSKFATAPSYCSFTLRNGPQLSLTLTKCKLFVQIPLTKAMTTLTKVTFFRISHLSCLLKQPVSK